MHLPLTLRQLVRVCKKASYMPQLLAQILRDSVLAHFLPSEIRQAVDRWLHKEIPQVEPVPKEGLARLLREKSEIFRKSLEGSGNAHIHLVPNILFHENLRHSEILQGFN